MVSFLIAQGAANAVLESRGPATWPVLSPSQPEWLAGQVARLWGAVCQRMVQSRQKN